MAERFIFRQFDYRNVELFLRDGEIRARNHESPQRCHQTSYQSIVDRRSGTQYSLPCGGTVNDYVPFYFSPITPFAYTIALGNVDVTSPKGALLGKSRAEDRVFAVCKTRSFANSELQFCFSDVPLNSGDLANISEDLTSLDTHVNWNVFDDDPMTAKIPEIGYGGVCQYFQSRNEEHYKNRNKQRMAEFLVRKALPLNFIECFLAKNQTIGANI